MAYAILNGHNAGGAADATEGVPSFMKPLNRSFNRSASEQSRGILQDARKLPGRRAISSCCDAGSGIPEPAPARSPQAVAQVKVLTPPSPDQPDSAFMSKPTGPALRAPESAPRAWKQPGSGKKRGDGGIGRALPNHHSVSAGTDLLNDQLPTAPGAPLEALRTNLLVPINGDPMQQSLGPNSFGTAFGAVRVEKLRSGRLHELQAALAACRAGTTAIFDLSGLDFMGDLGPLPTSEGPGGRMFGKSASLRPSGNVLGGGPAGSSGGGIPRCRPPPWQQASTANAMQHADHLTVWNEHSMEGQDVDTDQGPSMQYAHRTDSADAKRKGGLAGFKSYQRPHSAASQQGRSLQRQLSEGATQPMDDIASTASSECDGFGTAGTARFHSPQVITLAPHTDVLLYNGRVVFTPGQFFCIPHGASLQLHSVDVLGLPAYCLQQPAALRTAARRKAMVDAALHALQYRVHQLLPPADTETTPFGHNQGFHAAGSEITQRCHSETSSSSGDDVDSPRRAGKGHDPMNANSNANTDPAYHAQETKQLAALRLSGQQHSRVGLSAMRPMHVAAASGTGSAQGMVPAGSHCDTQHSSMMSKLALSAHMHEQRSRVSWGASAMHMHTQGPRLEDLLFLPGSSFPRYGNGVVGVSAQSGSTGGAGASQQKQQHAGVLPFPVITLEHALLEAEGGTITMHGCTIAALSRNQMAACASGGGRVHAQGCVMGPVCAAGAGSEVCMQRSVVLGGSGTVSLLGGAHAEMRGCALLGGGTDALEVKDDSSADVHSCTLAYAAQCGVSATTSAPPRLLALKSNSGTSTTPTTKTSLPGQAELENSERTARNADQASTCRVSLQNTRVYACGMHGICVHGGANSVAVTDCIVADHAQCCIEVEAGASVMVNSSKLAGSATASGVHASGTGTLCRIATSALYRNATCGAHAASGATLELSACAMYNNLQSGGHVSGTASLMVLAGGSIIKNGLHGLHADAGGILRAGKVLLAANARDGVALDGAGSHGSVRGCMVLDNREGGVTVTGSAHASVEDSKLSGNQHAGLTASGQGSRADAQRTRVSGNLAKGVGILHGACMELQHCSVHKNINTCVCVCGAGSSLTAQGCDMDEQPVAELGATALVR